MNIFSSIKKVVKESIPGFLYIVGLAASQISDSFQVIFPNKVWERVNKILLIICGFLGIGAYFIEKRQNPNDLNDLRQHFNVANENSVISKVTRYDPYLSETNQRSLINKVDGLERDVTNLKSSSSTINNPAYEHELVYGDLDDLEDQEIAVNIEELVEEGFSFFVGWPKLANQALG
ncbi:uncharacterized protein RJT21DRAFT_126928 [Scheffersomyces amazonensis]|uniref:uncharacterized protein n=1 Tax=Scheffersomyces amazonensis TaxID=1078765 RepID=UPI00315DC368